MGNPEYVKDGIEVRKVGGEDIKIGRHGNIVGQTGEVIKVLVPQVKREGNPDYNEGYSSRKP